MKIYRVKSRVQKSWVDYNRHMSAGYYSVVMNEISHGYFDYLRIGTDYRAQTNNSYFTVESHVTYQAELLEDEIFEGQCGLIDLDSRKFHFYVALFKLDGTLSATTEWLHLHMDMSVRKVAPFSAERLIHLQNILEQEKVAGIPESVVRVLGRSVGMDKS